MTKRQAAVAHPKVAPGQLLSIVMATLASKLNSAKIVKESPRFISECFREVGSPLCSRAPSRGRPWIWRLRPQQCRHDYRTD